MELLNFKYWLQGWLELENPESISKNQIEVIKKHIGIVKTQDHFMGWISGFIEGKKTIKGNDLKLLKEKVNNQFINITDSKTLEGLLDKGLPIFDKRFPRIKKDPEYFLEKPFDFKTAVFC